MNNEKCKAFQQFTISLLLKNASIKIQVLLLLKILNNIMIWLDYKF